MITIKNKIALAKMQEAGKRLADIFDALGDQVRLGKSTLEIDAWIEKSMQEKSLLPKCKGFMGYRHVSCISVNDEVVHGVPKADKIIKNGDIVTVDVVASFKGYCADMARTFCVGTVSAEAKKLAQVAQSSLERGIEKARAGNHLSDISAAIQEEVEKHGYGVVRDFAGHGIGKQMHEDPEVLNYGLSGKGPVLRAGMTLAIEPMITMGHFDVYVDSDGWTAKTKDGSLAAHVEDTVAITEQGPVVLTRLYVDEKS